MGKLSGLITTAAFFGILAILIYFCCRLKRKRNLAAAGTNGGNRWSDVFFKQNDVREEGGSGSGPAMYPNATFNPVPHSSIVNPNATFNQTPYPQAYPGQIPQVPAAYPTPYPLGLPNNMPMPMPVMGEGVSYERHQATAPPFSYPTPSGRPDDLPPSYSEAINHPRY